MFALKITIFVFILVLVHENKPHLTLGASITERLMIEQCVDRICQIRHLPNTGVASYGTTTSADDLQICAITGRFADKTFRGKLAR